MTGPTEGMLHSLRRFVRDFATYSGGQGAMAALLVALGSVLDGLGVLLLVPIIAVVLDSGARGGLLQAAASWLFAVAGAETRFTRLSAMLGGFVLLLLLRGLVNYWRDVLLVQLQTGFVEDKRIGITARLARARWGAVARLRHARINNLMGADIAMVGGAANYLVQGAVALAMLISQVVLAFVLSPVMAAIGVALLILGGLGTFVILIPASRLGRFTADANLRLIDSSMQFLGGVKLAISQNLQESFVREYRDTIQAVSDERIAFTRRTARNRVLGITLTGMVGAAVVLVGFGILNKAPAVLLPLLYLMARMNAPALIIQQYLQQLFIALPAHDNIRALEEELDRDQLVPPTGSGSATAIPPGAICFHNVTFAHRDDTGRNHVLFNGLELVIAEGSFVGLSGASGAGKTSFADLLAGLYPPHAGEITCGGISLTGPTLEVWRSHISYVSQDPFLFHDTIRRNLAWAAPDATEADIWEALVLAGADRLVRQLPDGLETLTGERGILISGGERQRLALARGLLRKPRLLILDEATNAIDIAGEAQLLLRLRALQPRPTILIIAHRQESLGQCDEVLTLDQGRISNRLQAAQSSINIQRLL